VIKSRRKRWARHAACMRRMRNVHKILVVNPEGKHRLEDLGVDGRKGLILK
jgi:hypothetical protein